MTYGSPSKCGIEGCRNEGKILRSFEKEKIYICLFHEAWLTMQTLKGNNGGQQSV